MDPSRPEPLDTRGWRLRGGTPRRVDPPPRGRLFQEDLADRPFWMLVACSLVNLTNWETAEPVYSALAAAHDVGSLAAADEGDLHDLLRPLGLWRRRSSSIVAMARAWSAA